MMLLMSLTFCFVGNYKYSTENRESPGKPPKKYSKNFVLLIRLSFGSFFNDFRLFLLNIR